MLFVDEKFDMLNNSHAVVDVSDPQDRIRICQQLKIIRLGPSLLGQSHSP